SLPGVWQYHEAVPATDAVCSYVWLTGVSTCSCAMPAPPLEWMRSTNAASLLMLRKMTLAPTLRLVTAGAGYTHWPFAVEVSTSVTWFATVTSLDVEIAGSELVTSTFSLAVSILVSVGIITVALTVIVPFCGSVTDGVSRFTIQPVIGAPVPSTADAATL